MKPRNPKMMSFAAIRGLVLVVGLAIIISDPFSRASAQKTSSCSSDDVDEDGTCYAGDKIDIVCDPLPGNAIDWDCVFGPESLEEVHERGGLMTTCPSASAAEPCNRFIVAKSAERAEVKVQEGPDGFPFLKHEKYIFKYSFKPKEGMRVAKRFTHLGQLKGSAGGYMVKGDPIYSLTANNNGLMVRFSNKESIEDYYPGMEEHMNWDDATGEWVHVKLTTVFGESMEVELSGAAQGKAVWPKHLKPVAWHRDSEMVRMKLGLYHSKGNVHDQEVEYKNISIEGPNGRIRTSNKIDDDNMQGEPGGHHYRGCFKDTRERIFDSKSTSSQMTNEKCAAHCKGSRYFGTQSGRECWCGDSKANYKKYGKAECNVPCSGDGDDTCGGAWAMSIYEDGGKPSVVPDDTVYLGCYGDSADDRALTLGTKTSRNEMTYKKCFEHCDGKRSTTHMALEAGEKCFCGSLKDDFDRYGEAICGVPCSGDKTSICGGREAMVVFKM